MQQDKQPLLVSRRSIRSKPLNAPATGFSCRPSTNRLLQARTRCWQLKPLPNSTSKSKSWGERSSESSPVNSAAPSQCHCCQARGRIWARSTSLHSHRQTLHGQRHCRCRRACSMRCSTVTCTHAGGLVQAVAAGTGSSGGESLLVRGGGGGAGGCLSDWCGAGWRWRCYITASTTCSMQSG
jgi:hypothetical protein